jgi:hypothetical protein
MIYQFRANFQLLSARRHDNYRVVNCQICSMLDRSISAPLPLRQIG